jgi:APA family basic amino acid/polyamine antiporter
MLVEWTSPAFAIALIFVSYSYSGWNAAAYITEEFVSPNKSLPIALIGGSTLVALLYTLLQFVFLKHVPISELAGQLDIGIISAEAMLGKTAGNWFGLMISLLLVSSISAMVWVGSRVTSTIAVDYHFWRFFKAQKTGIPVRALWLQFGISTLMILTGTFEQILIYCGVLLTFSTLMTVISIFILRKTQFASIETSFKSPFYPLFQVIFIIISIWMIIFALKQNSIEIMFGLINLVIGYITWIISKNYNHIKK